MVEASGVTAAGRITPQCLGIWKDEHIDAHASLVSALRTVAPGLTVGIQLAHAGRKASTWSPYHRGEKKHKDYVTDAEGGWEGEVVAPSAVAYGEGWITPRELSTKEMEELQEHFIRGADRAFQAGYDCECNRSRLCAEQYADPCCSRRAARSARLLPAQLSLSPLQQAYRRLRRLF
jgi:2,4-dienoyl-CoA reductase-like NADH-dependent reductase (Old Yellow Enzyme family)